MEQESSETPGLPSQSQSSRGHLSEASNRRLGSFTARLFAISASITIVFALCFFLSGDTLLQRPFWMDEVHSWLLITDPDPQHALKALSQGADYNPPVYYAIARCFTAVAGQSESSLRLMSLLLSVGTAITVACVLARRLAWPVAVGGSLLICSQLLFILQTTEARFYGLWLFLMAVFCSLPGSSNMRLPAWKIGLLCLLSALIAGTHYFGIISVGIVCFACWASHRFERSRLWECGLPLATAIAVVAACLPLLSGQKEALTVDTWVRPPTLASATTFVTQFFPGLILVAVGVIWVVSRFVASPEDAETQDECRGSLRSAQPTKAPIVHPDDAAFGSLLLMPFALIVFSFVIQPATVNRYAAVGTLWLVPVIVHLLRGVKGNLRILVSVAGVVLFALAVRHGTATWKHNLEARMQLADDLAKLPAGVPVLFEDRVDYWMLQQREPSNTWYQLDFEDAPEDQLANLRLVQRDVARAIERVYPQPFRLKAVEDLGFGEFYLVSYHDRDPQLPASDRPWSLEKIADSVFLVTPGEVKQSSRGDGI